jgi:hypothetical protein
MILPMRHIKAIPLISFLAGFGLNLALAQPLKGPVQGPQAPEAPPTFELDKKGKRTHVDFALNPKAISDGNLKLSTSGLLFFRQMSTLPARLSHCAKTFR